MSSAIEGLTEVVGKVVIDKQHVAAVVRDFLAANGLSEEGSLAISDRAPGRNRTCNTRFRKPLMSSLGDVNPLS